MDSEQKSTEGKKTLRFDAAFMDYLSDFYEDEQDDIIKQLIFNDEILPKQDDYTQHLGGRLNNNKVYFILEFINETHYKSPIYLDIEEITLDEYLDLMIKKETLQRDEDGI
tara:strand:- start:846 stop:1178 length:333 start_codon:yes stop_codon:yes gene_type:complete